MAALIAFGAPAAALAWTNYTFSSTDETRTITLINQARAAAGLPAVVESSALDDVAEWRAKDMWDRNYFSHSIPSPPGGMVFDELKRRGICYTVAGENIGRNNYPDDQTTQVNFNGWMNSSTHKAIILGSGFNRIGVGAFKGTGTTYPMHEFVAIFTHSCSSATPTPTPNPTPTKTPAPTPNPTPTKTPAPTKTPGPTPNPTPTKTPAPTKTPGPGATPTPTPRVTPQPTPKPTTEPTPTPDHRTPEPTAAPTAEPTPEPTPDLTPDPAVSAGTVDVLIGGAVYAIWRDEVAGGNSDGFWPQWPNDAIATDPPAIETESPGATEAPPTSESAGDGGIATDSDGGSLQVVEPPSSQGLLDTIVGGVLASFLGK